MLTLVQCLNVVKVLAVSSMVLWLFPHGYEMVSRAPGVILAFQTISRGKVGHNPQLSHYVFRKIIASPGAFSLQKKLLMPHLSELACRATTR